jgi:hypothetical protein
VLKTVKDMEGATGLLPPGSSTKVQMALGDEKAVSFWMPAFWGIGVILFCIACFFGTKAGIHARVPTYLPLDKLIGDTKPTKDELALLYELRWSLQANAFPPEEVETLFKEVIQPILRQEEKKQEGKNPSSRTDPNSTLPDPIVIPGAKPARYYDLMSVVDRLIKIKKEPDSKPVPYKPDL